jgi:carbon-monoxide dehydrogenase iron sulfur subunit
MPQKTLAPAIVVHVERCVGCRSCELACAKAHAAVTDIVEAFRSGVPLVPRVRVVEADGHPVPVQCRHCESPACVEACPVQALHRDEAGGPVRLDAEKCVGCMGCVIACPYGAVEYHEQLESVAKCDLCEGIVEDGQEPRCVAACPTGALSLGESDA